MDKTGLHFLGAIGRGATLGLLAARVTEGQFFGDAWDALGGSDDSWAFIRDSALVEFGLTGSPEELTAALQGVMRSMQRPFTGLDMADYPRYARAYSLIDGIGLLWLGATGAEANEASQAAYTDAFPSTGAWPPLPPSWPTPRAAAS